MAKDTLNVAVCQMTSVDSVQKNLEQIKERLNRALNHSDLDLICFPENALYMRLKEGEAIEGLSLSHQAFAELSKLATQYKVSIHIGASPVLEENNLFNRSVLIKATGEVQAGYQKIHLFDVDLANQRSIRESDIFASGNSLECFEIEGWKIAQSICYDLRFSELFSQYKARFNPDIFLVPSAFTVPTGKAHWSTLLKARAIETQCYVLAAAQGGEHKSERGTKHTYGHSHIIDPWGELLATANDDEPIIFGTLSKQRIKDVRGQIPMASHRKLSPYH